MILLGTLICFNFVIKDTGIYKIKSFAVVKKKYSHCRTVAIASSHLCTIPISARTVEETGMMPKWLGSTTSSNASLM